ncbi:MAG: nuclear transport factor 2 family protein [Planctomycetota bacterium]|jgi:ketosteroid isomerase-like protein|nr:nuclear transport factor 2 family protein [Planctomycetota bacterium]
MSLIECGPEGLEEAVDAFYAGLLAMFGGDAAPMKAAWWHDADVSYMGPGGDHRIGWDEVAAECERQAGLHLGGQVSPERRHVMQGEDLAVFTCVETGANVVDGTPAPVSIRASTVLRKRNGSWKVVAHQSDRLDHVAITS